MSSLIKRLLIGSCASCFAITGCAADGFFDSATAANAQRRGESLFEPPPTQRRPQAAAERIVESPARVTKQPATRASFQLSDPPSVAAHLPPAMLPTTQKQIPSLSEVNKKPSRTLVTLGPDDDLAEMVRAASGVVLIDFYADWCGPCRTQGAILHEMQTKPADRDASIIKVNVDQHAAIANALKVESLPTLVLVKDGKVVARKIGLSDEREVSLMLAR